MSEFWFFRKGILGTGRAAAKMQFYSTKTQEHKAILQTHHLYISQQGEIVHKTLLKLITISDVAGNCLPCF